MPDLLRTYTTIEYEHENIHNGVFYEFYSKFQLAANNGTKIISMKTPATGYVHLSPPTYFSSADKLTIEYFEGATQTAETGTAITAVNHNRVSTNTPKATLLDAPTVTNNGTKFAQVYIPGSTGVGGTRYGESVGGTKNEWVLKQNTVYLIKFSNASTSANDVQINAQWYEN